MLWQNWKSLMASASSVREETTCPASRVGTIWNMFCHFGPFLKSSLPFAKYDVHVLKQLISAWTTQQVSFNFLFLLNLISVNMSVASVTQFTSEIILITMLPCCQDSVQFFIIITERAQDCTYFVSSDTYCAPNIGSALAIIRPDHGPPVSSLSQCKHAYCMYLCMYVLHVCTVLGSPTLQPYSFFFLLPPPGCWLHLLLVPSWSGLVTVFCSLSTMLPSCGFMICTSVLCHRTDHSWIKCVICNSWDSPDP